MSENNIYPELSRSLVWTRLEDAMDREFIKPQINADERRFVNLDIQRLSEVYQRNSPIKSPQRSQSSVIPATAYEPAPPSQQGTRMTRIARIFTDTFNPYASASSAQSAFYCLPSAFYSAYPRLISNRKTQEALAR